MLLRNRGVIQLIIAAINPTGRGWLLWWWVTAPCAPLAWNNKAITALTAAAKQSNKTSHRFMACPKLTGCSFTGEPFAICLWWQDLVFCTWGKRKKIQIEHNFVFLFPGRVLFPLLWFHDIYPYYYHHHHYYLFSYLAYVEVLALIKTFIFKTNCEEITVE